MPTGKVYPQPFSLESVDIKGILLGTNPMRCDCPGLATGRKLHRKPTLPV